MSYFTKNIRWLLPLLYGAASVVLAALLHYGSSLDNLQAWKEANVFWLVAGLISTAAVWTTHSYPTKVGILLYAFILGTVAGLLCFYADIALIRLWAGKDGRHLSFLARTWYDRLVLSLALNIPVTLVTAMNRKLVAMKERFVQHAGAESLLRDAELFKLRQQLQPHFLYNSLNAINSLIIIDADKAQEMVGRLSDFLRASVKRDSNELQPIAEELAYLEDYLAIEAVRFGDRLRIVYRREDTDDAKLPPFLLQPLIENAIKFGLYGQTGEVTIYVHIYLEPDFLVVQIANPFDPLAQPAKGTGFGLESIRRRLYLLYGRNDLVQAGADGHEFTTTLKIPRVYVQSATDR